jgi:hypothetical protein
MGKNANEFNGLHTTIDGLLRKKLGLFDDKVGFASILSKANKERIITDNQKKFLTMINELRNIIIHNDNYLFPQQVIAEPHEDIIEKMRLFVEQLENPKTVQNLKSNPPRVFEEDERLVDCITHMKKNDYSQVVVHRDISYDLITREDIARWFEQQIENNELIIPLEDKRIKDIFAIDLKDEFRLLPKSATLPTLLDAFQPKTREKIAAVLITENGRNTEKPINIFTQWDFPDIYKEIEEY